jgi:hypothetical protein
MEELVWDTQKEDKSKTTTTTKTKMRTGLHAIWDAEFSTNNKAKTHLVQSKDLSFLHFSLVEVKDLPNLNHHLAP